jgi:hypothetical protein
MAETGQNTAQVPQSVQRSVIRLAWSCRRIAIAGQTEAHPPQKVQRFWSMVYMVKQNHSGGGKKAREEMRSKLKSSRFKVKNRQKKPFLSSEL